MLSFPLAGFNFLMGKFILLQTIFCTLNSLQIEVHVWQTTPSFLPVWHHGLKWLHDWNVYGELVCGGRVLGGVVRAEGEEEGGRELGATSLPPSHTHSAGRGRSERRAGGSDGAGRGSWLARRGWAAGGTECRSKVG